jgi:hypothetical protein
VSEDPIGFAGGDANLGRYVGNFATGAVDWSGLFDDPLDIGFGTMPNGRLHIPSDKRGKWTNGVKGNGTFTFDDTEFNRARGVAGLSIDFVDGYIAVGGFPERIYWNGDRSGATVEINEVFGDARDGDAADTKMREIYGKEWKRPRGYTWNHAGKPTQRVMELVATEVHSAVHHAGNASRSVGRTRPAGIKIRGLIVLDVYLTMRDALDYAGGLPAEGAPLDHCDHTFIDEDGSVFVVQVGWFTKKKFIAGPKMGQVEAITWNEADEYKRAAEAKWGRWSQWEQKFYPGTHRKRIEAIDPNSGEYKGYYDEEGFHGAGPALSRIF